MGIVERREREKQQLRLRILEAARDIVSEDGLDALSMRALAERIEYSPATIYLYFQDKDDLLRSIVVEGFRRLGESMRRELEVAGADASALERYRSLGRGYVSFALENTAYFRVIFELPTVARVDCLEPTEEDAPFTRESSWDFVVATLQEAVDGGEVEIPDAFRGAVIGWASLHGLVSLYLTGHLADEVETREQLEELVTETMDSLHHGWAPGGRGRES